MAHERKGELPRIELAPSTGWTDYELVDSGSGSKLERYGPYSFIRPEPQAVWTPALPDKTWAAAHATFQVSNEENGGHWQFRVETQPRWRMAYRDLKFWAATSASRHLGVFPEQACQWDWAAAQIETITRAGSQPKVLNLFGYTGLASLAAAQAGAHVTHLDASRKVIGWGQENQALSGLKDRPIRWIEDDALKFTAREARRGAAYDGLILDPPKFGRGPKGEVWEFYKLLPSLLESCRAILAPRPAFVVLTAYAIQASALTLYYALEGMMSGLGGAITAGELVTIEKSAGRILSNAIYARWQA
jgi:23S rRNA (cytosine1962-C5)-methyltransferase